jgi:mono/diheme cytochrome c family protein
MRRAGLMLAGALIVLVTGAMATAGYVRATGLESRSSPGTLETRVSRIVRRLAVPSGVRGQHNPVQASPEALVEAMSHFADHCANCHANDGSGNTEMGRGLYPKAPDMRLMATQALTDGELFWIIEHGIRFTGMPAWGTGTAAGEASTWQLVHFIRHLPVLTDAEREAMERMNPRSPEAIRLELEEERFLNEGVQ